MSDVFEWVDELPPRDPVGKEDGWGWGASATRLRESPGVWALIEEYEDRHTAYQRTNSLRVGWSDIGFLFAWRGKSVYAMHDGREVDA